MPLICDNTHPAHALALLCYKVPSGCNKSSKFILLDYIGHFWSIVTDRLVQNSQVCALMEMAAGLAVQMGGKTHHPWKYSPCARFCTCDPQGCQSYQTAGLPQKPPPARPAHHKGGRGARLSGHPVSVEAKGRQEVWGF